MSGADVADLARRIPRVLAVPPGLGPTPWPPELRADRGYDSRPHRAGRRSRGVDPHIGRRRGPGGPDRRRDRYVVERTIAAVHQSRRRKVRYDKRADIHQAFRTIAGIKVCWYRLDPDRP